MNSRWKTVSRALMVFVVTLMVIPCVRTLGGPAKGPVDPGVRGGAPGAGSSLNNLSADEAAYFRDGIQRFAEIEVVSGGSNNGLGPRFNSNQCLSCHSQPAPGGSSPANNPLMAVATLNGARNDVPWYIVPNGPAREVRFKRSANGSNDGGVHNLFVITGRTDAPGCKISQPDFLPAGNPITGQGGNSNLAFRIPTPMFGAGLIEAIPDSEILANMHADTAQKSDMGISGHPNAHQSGNVNLSGNDGTITRFGWKAQNKSLLMFAGEAYNVEMGISNQLFPQERDENPGCLYNALPNDALNFTPTAPNGAAPYSAVISDIEAFANYMRMLAPPTPAPDTASTVNGRATFIKVGCAQCHTPSFTTGKSMASGSSRVPSPALSNQKVNLWSDLLVHHMGKGLADGITQGSAGPDEFRTAPLWGLGQRVFFLHDGRTTDLVETIKEHKSQNSEANKVIDRYEHLKPLDKQDLINFLRSL